VARCEASRRVRGLSPRMQTPHPALRATFSHKGRRKSASSLARTFHGYQGQGLKRRVARRGRQRHADQGPAAERLVHRAQARHRDQGHLTDNADEIEGRTDKVKGLVLRTEFLKKA
jgi:hypothetical protein